MSVDGELTCVVRKPYSVSWSHEKGSYEMCKRRCMSHKHKYAEYLSGSNIDAFMVHLMNNVCQTGYVIAL